MSHSIQYYNYEENVDKNYVQSKLDGIAKRNSSSRSELEKPIRWLTKICDSEDSAMEYINEVDSHWYDQLAVRYTEISIPKESKKYSDMVAKKNELMATYQQLNNTVAFKDFKSEYVGCKTCGSKLSTKYMRTNKCPLCGGEMRSQTTLDKLARLQAKIKELDKLIKEEEMKLRAKNQKKAVVMWLVKIEYHV